MNIPDHTENVQRAFTDAAENLHEEEQFALYYRLKQWLDSTVGAKTRFLMNQNRNRQNGTDYDSCREWERP